MPGRKCIICGQSSLVTNKEGTNKSYFSFPRDENLRKKWVNVCQNKIDNIITARICSDHFKEEDFLHNKNGPEEVRKKRLKCNVVPSINLEATNGKQSRNNVNFKNNSTENSKDCLKKRDSSKETESIKDQNSILHSKRKSTSVNKNSKSIRDQIKRKSISENNKHPSMLPKQTNVKGLNNKENTKGLTKRKNRLENISLGIKEISKNKMDKDSLKNKSKSLNNISIKKDLPRHKVAEKSISKENKKEISVEKFNNLANDTLKNISKEQKLTKPMITKSSKKGINKKKSYPEIHLEDQNESIIGKESEFPNEKSSENNKDETKDTLESNSENVDANKKTKKRKSLLSNEMPRKVHKKRIRLGKDDSEDSEDSSSECTSTICVSRNKITYKSPSEMAENEDLLKYLNYLKEKSKSTDQPILFWVDD